MTPRLRALDPGEDIPLEPALLLVGRSSDCDIVLNSNKVSRKHCCLAFVGDRLLIRDLGSTNGLRVNGNPTAEGSVSAGDELAIGDCRYRLELAAGHAKAVPNGDEALVPAKLASGSAEQPILPPGSGTAARSPSRQESTDGSRPIHQPNRPPLSTTDPEKPEPNTAGSKSDPLFDDEIFVIPDKVSLAPITDSEIEIPPRPRTEPLGH